ncbi:MAG: SdpI family protein [Tyzzerella sp.]|nr:SdpI family protein [Tyzzerella sp.]
MIKKNKGKLILTSIIILLPILIGLILWGKLPDKVPTHWNAEGVVDGWSSKGFAVFGMPAFLFVIHWFCLLVSNADPKRQNYSEKLFQLVFWICPVLSVLVGVLTYGTALGMEFKVDTIMLILMGLMFIIIGNYLPKCKQNYTMGIKLPWTLYDEENWNKTHRLGGKLWVVSGFIMLLCILAPTSIMVVILIIILSVAMIVPMAYSYLLHRNKMKSGE